MRKALFLPVFALGLIPAAAFAAQFVVPTGQSSAVVIAEGEYSDLYTAGGTVTVTRPIQGDLFAAGGEVGIHGSVGQDLFAAGGSLNVIAAVTGDAHLAGGSLTFLAPVGEDLLAAGGTIVVSPAATIGGDLRLAGGNIVVQGSVFGVTNIYGEEVYINSALGGPVSIVAKKLTFGPQSNIPATVYYKGPREAVVEDGAAVPNIQFTLQEFEKKPTHAPAFFAAGFFIMLLATLIAALLLLKFFGNTVRTVVTTAYGKPWASLGLGFVGLIVAPVAVIILLATVVGLYLAMLLVMWFVLAMLLTGLLSAIFTGALLFKWIQKTPDLQFSWWSVAAGVIVIGVLKLIPVIGWLLVLVIFLMVFGSVLQTLKAQIVSVHMKK
ncbi:MAG: hypothetical protein AAB490_02570 [Patescibacteria group bacterium]